MIRFISQLIIEGEQLQKLQKLQELQELQEILDSEICELIASFPRFI